MRKNRGRLLSSPPTASAASLDISPGRCNFRTEIRHPAVTQTATGSIPFITLRLQASEDKGTDAKADTGGGSGVDARSGFIPDDSLQ